MEKKVLQNYGWIVILTLTLSVILSAATPLGKYVGNGVASILKGFDETRDTVMGDDHMDALESKWEEVIDNPYTDRVPEDPPSPEQTTPINCKHKNSTLANKKISTCTIPGYTGDMVCQSCNEILSHGVEIAPTGHGKTAIVNTKAPTCGEEGYTGDEACEDCLMILVPGSVIAKLPHAHVSTVGTVPVTCLNNGYTGDKVCNDCGETTEKGSIITMLPHTVANDARVEPTCVNTGLTAGTHCSVCSTVLVKQDIIPATGHNYNGVVTTAPKCTVEGIKTFTCQNAGCGSYYTQPVAATGHTSSTLAYKAPTCTATGLKQGSKCSVCNTILVAQEVIPATGHNYQNPKITTAATCTKEGVRTYYCSNSGCSSTRTEAISATGHTATTLAYKAPTCTATGLKQGSKCSVCSAILVAQEVIPATGHNYKSAVTTAATCTTDGVRIYTCQNCSNKYTEAIPKTGHTETTLAYKAPTCTETGLNAGKKCTVCGTITVAQTVIAAKGHTETTLAYKAPTCTATGLTEGKKCTVCGVATVPQQTIAANGHTETALAYKAPTCTATGLTAGKKCTVCGTITVAQTTIAATGHKNGTDDGSCLTAIKCANGCGTIMTAAKTAHSFTDTSDTTCNNSGCSYSRTVYTIVYNLNGGSGSVANQYVLPGATITTGSATPTRSGYVFLGWSTNSDNTDDGYGWTNWTGTWDYTNGQYKIQNNTLTLYARWTSSEAFTIKYNVNGGSGSFANQTVSYGTKITVGAGVPTRNGYTFKGWSTNSNNTDDGHGWTNWAGTWRYYNGQYGISGNVLQLYAVWEPNVIKITLNANGGSGGTTVFYYRYGISTFYSDAACTNQITNITRPTRQCYAYNTTKGFYGDGTSGGTSGERYVSYDSVIFASDLATDIYKDATLKCEWTVSHSNVVVINAKAATCTATGYTGDNYCNGCKTTISTGSTIAALGHSYGSWTSISDTQHKRTCANDSSHTETANHSFTTTTNATCTTAGSKKCGTCSKTLSIAALNHPSTKTINAKAATCTATGYTGDTYCNTCAKTIATGSTIAKKSHTSVSVAAVAATCTTAGKTAGTKCSVCGTILSGCTTVAAKGHTFDSDDVDYDWESDCSDGCYASATCTVCKTTIGEWGDIECNDDSDSCEYDYSAYFDNFPSTSCPCWHGSHSWYLSSSSDGDCETEGYEYYECNDCSDTYEETTGYGDHCYCESDSVDGTCETEGYETETCCVCGDTNTTYTGYGDHNYSCVSSTEGTCTSEGYDTLECQYCGDSYDEPNGTGGDHCYCYDSTTDGTCSSEGYDTYVCCYCGDSYDEGNGEYSDCDTYIVDQAEATCGEDGYVSWACYNCDWTATDTIPATGDHDYLSAGTTDGSCVEECLDIYVCANCGDSYHEGSGSYGDHSYELTSSEDATCGSDGYETYTCSECGDSYDETIPATGDHHFVTICHGVEGGTDNEDEEWCGVCGESYYTSCDHY